MVLNAVSQSLSMLWCDALTLFSMNGANNRPMHQCKIVCMKDDDPHSKMPYEKNLGVQDLQLGQATEYPSEYTPGLLQAVPRKLNRAELGIVEQQPFVGCDVWHAYELSWLNAKGKPVVALARCSVDAASSNIIESKSFKLYLNSFNQTRFATQVAVQQTIINDLSAVAGQLVQVELFAPDQAQALPVSTLPGECIDALDIQVDDFTLNPQGLAVEEGERVAETLHSHLLKSNCLITNQPDWASVVIQYQGFRLNREALLRYLISFRMHNEFHEQCVERIFTDIQQYCSPEKLSVQALYTRRGGLDINPYRSSHAYAAVPMLRINRQ